MSSSETSASNQSTALTICLSVFVLFADCLSAPAVMSLSRLASVEVQLIMQLLLRGELLQLARCSRAMLHSADAPHVWRFVEPILVSADAAPPASTSLLRHVPLIFEWTPPRGVTDLGAISDTFLARLAGVPTERVSGVDAWRSSRWIPADAWLRVLSDERLSQVRSIALQPPIPVSEGVSASLITVMFRLRWLHTLRISDVATESDGSSALAALPSFPSLTALDIASYISIIEPAQFEPVAQCTQLRSLGWTVDDATWAALSQSPSFSRIERLQFRWITCDQWSARFRSIESMRSLRELHLYFLRSSESLASSVEGLAPLLPPSLRLLVLRPSLSINQRVSIDSMVRILSCSLAHVRLQLFLKPIGLNATDESDICEARRSFAEFNDALSLQPFKDSGRLSVRMCVASAPPPPLQPLVPKPPRCEPRRK